MNVNDNIKVFIALDIPIRDDNEQIIHFDRIQQQIQQLLPAYKPYTKFHSTIAFIGLLSAEQIAIIKRASKEVAHLFRESKKMTGIGGITIADEIAPYGKNAIGLRIIGNDTAFKRLIDLLGTHLTVSGISFDDRNQHLPLHITLGRFYDKNIDKNKITDLLAQIPSPKRAQAAHQHTFTIKTMTLYQSLPGSEYNPLETYEI